MSNQLKIESLTSKPPCGLSVVDRALAGSQDAQRKVVEILPEMGMKPPAGLTPIEWAAIGLQSAREDLERLLKTS
jgi:formate-dependent nitrite reductase cytochrome c552 subunit